MFFHKLISYLLHPIIFSLIGSVFFLYTNPRFINKDFKLLILLIVFVGTYLIPISLLFFLKKLKMIDSFHLSKIEERKFPVLLFSFIAILIGKLFFKTEVLNHLALFFIVGGLSFLLIYLFLWFKLKVSIHTLAIGSLIGFVINTSILYHQNHLVFIGFLFILFSFIANARIKLQAHVFKEVILGVLIGILSQITVVNIYQNI